MGRRIRTAMSETIPTLIGLYPLHPYDLLGNCHVNRTRTVCLDCEAVRQVRPTPDVPTPADVTPSRRPGTQQPPQHVLLWDDEELPSGRGDVLLKICFVARSPNRSDHAPSFRQWNAMWPPSNQ